jgi:pyridinium-3,5-biscarboxylic acid mononucleotide synthase
MLDAETCRELLQAVASGHLQPELALDQLRRLDTEAVGDFARLDHHRTLRTGFPEVIWGQDKTVEQLVALFQRLGDRQPVTLATRIRPGVYELLRNQVRDLRYHPEAAIAVCQTGDVPPRQGRIGILSAGTSDLPVAEEAAVTAAYCGFNVNRLWDVGVAGLHRILNQRELLDQADVLIVVAGMEGALPSVVAGLVRAPVIAVPTSIGYGASFGGLAALLGMLNACATGIGVVNIDNGFGAAMLAARMLSRDIERSGTA